MFVKRPKCSLHRGGNYEHEEWDCDAHEDVWDCWDCLASDGNIHPETGRELPRWLVALLYKKSPMPTKQVEEIIFDGLLEEATKWQQ